MLLLAQFLLCSSAIFTPLRFHTPEYGIQYQTNGHPCTAPGEFGKAIDASYHEFVCGDVEYECSPDEDEFGNRPNLGNGMMAACYVEPESTCQTPRECLDELYRSLRMFTCRFNLITLNQTDIYVQRFDWHLPGRCTNSLRWAVVQHDDLLTRRATIVVSSLIPVSDLRDVLRKAWPRALFKDWVGEPGGCIE